VQSHVDDQPNLFQSVVGYVGVLLRLERRLLALVVSYSLAIGLFSLIVPLTVQELTNTFAFAIQPVTIVTLAGVMIALLFFFMVGLGVVIGAELNAALADYEPTALKGEIYSGPFKDELEIEEPSPGEDVAVELEKEPQL